MSNTDTQKTSDTSSAANGRVGSGDSSASDEDAFSDWNRKIDNYVPTLWDAYLFGLNRGRNESKWLANALACVLAQAPGRDNNALLKFGQETLNRWECVYGPSSDFPARHSVAHKTMTSP